MPEPSNEDLREVIDAVCQAAIVLIGLLYEQPEQDRTPANMIAMMKELADHAAKDEKFSDLARVTFSRFSVLFETWISIHDVKSPNIN